MSFKSPLLIFCFFACVYLLCNNGRILTVDARSMYEVTRSIVDKGSFAVDADTPGAHGGIDGQYYSKYGLGKSLVNTPFYAVGKIMARIYPRFPEQYFCFFAVSLVNPLLTALACALLFVVCGRFGFTDQQSLWLTCAYGFGTIAFTYAKDDMSEPLATLLVLSGVFSAYLYTLRQNRRWILLSATLLGFCVGTRYSLSLLPIITGVYLVAKSLPALMAKRYVAWRDVASFGSILIAFAALWAAYNYVRFGSVSETGYGLEGTSVSSLDFTPGVLLPHLAALIISPGRGLLFYMPVLVLAVPGFLLFLRSRRAEALLCLSIFLSTWLLHSASLWDGGWSWGPRFLLPVLPLFVLCAGFALRLKFFQKPLGRAVANGLLALSIIIQLTSVIVTWQRYMHEVASREEQGQRVDIIWSMPHAQPLNQWRHLVEVLSLSAEDRRRMSYEAQTSSEREVLQKSLGVNVPDIWFVHFYFLGVPSALIAFSVGCLLIAACLFAQALRRHLRLVPQSAASP